MIKFFFPFLLLVLLGSCTQTSKVDLLIYNAKIYTVDSGFSVVEAMAIRDGKILEVGSTKEITGKYFSDNKINAKGQFIYPGLIDAHTHFFNYGLGLQTVNLVDTKSWNEVLERVKAFAKDHPDGWLRGRGWDQNDWKVEEYPSKEKLDSLFPDRPVILGRVDGHAAIANQKALELAGITPGLQLEGGSIEMKQGKLTGILVDNAVDLVTKVIPQPTAQQITQALQNAQQNCFAQGLTTVDDCGLDFPEVLAIDSLQKKGIVKMRVYAMLSDAPKNFDFLFKKGKIKTDFLDVRSFKVYADGALGSRGACLLQPYTDRKNWYGFLLSPQQHFDSVARIIAEHGFQMCTHAIGDSANRTILKIYARYLKGKNDRRWRIEHAQVIDKNDFPLFALYSVIPSVQPTHATSDMYWDIERLGPERVKSAYAYRQLMEQNGWIPLGTDFPVEDISPFKTFHSAVFRTDSNNHPNGGYHIENSLSREQAIRGMTIWAARSNFEEGEKGSLEKGKFADFVILDKDLMTATPQDVLLTTVKATYIGGKEVYSKN